MNRTGKVLNGSFFHYKKEFTGSLYAMNTDAQWHVLNVDLSDMPYTGGLYDHIIGRFTPDLIVLLSHCSKTEADFTVFSQTRIQQSVLTLETVPPEKLNIMCHCSVSQGVTTSISDKHDSCPTDLFNVVQSKAKRLIIVDSKNADHSSCFLNRLLAYSPLAQASNSTTEIEFDMIIDQNIRSNHAIKLIEKLGMRYENLIIVKCYRTNSTTLRIISSPSVYWKLLLKIGKKSDFVEEPNIDNEIKINEELTVVTIKSINFDRLVMESGAVIDNQSSMTLMTANGLIERINQVEHHQLVEQLVNLFSPKTT